jgi:tRNA-dihydrouridine synthase B
LTAAEVKAAAMFLGNLKLATNLLLSPIAGYCDLAFRLVVRPLGGLGLACTDLVNPRGVLRQSFHSMELIRTEPGDEPLCVQFYGTDAEEMADAARWCRDRGATVIDINMGCPIPRICARGGGAALLADPRSAARLAERVVKAVDAPVTAKLRLGLDDTSIVAPHLAADLERAGVAGVTVHGRTVADGFSGPVRLDGIARVVEAVRSIPIIGNGDVRRPEDARRMIEATGCAGVMIGRAALRDPWIFRDTHALLDTGQVPPPPSAGDRLRLISRHFAHLVRIKGERAACAVMRQRFSWYARALAAPASWRDRMRLIRSAEGFRRLVESYPAVAELQAIPAVSRPGRLV